MNDSLDNSVPHEGHLQGADPRQETAGPRLIDLKADRDWDVGIVLALNNGNAAELSELDPAKLKSLIAEAFQAVIIAPSDALLIAFDQDADYASPNFLWHSARRNRFVYVDRVVVAPAARGRGLARNLYRALFAKAVRAGHFLVTCEINAVPPNPASDAFHEALGFSVVGEAEIHGGVKRVRYFEKALTLADLPPNHPEGVTE